MTSAAFVRVPGKLLLTGEYAVLEGKSAIAAAVSRFVTCEASVAEDTAWAISGMGCLWREGGPNVPLLSFARAALGMVRRYLSGKGVRIPPLALRIEDDLRAPDGQKLGLGGSACTCVAVVRAALMAASQAHPDFTAPLAAAPSRARELDRIFKLAAIAHVLVQNKVGSCVDVAASAFGGLILTEKFDFTPFEAAVLDDPSPTSNAHFARLIDTSPLHPVRTLSHSLIPQILLLFGGKSASTTSHVAAVRQAADAHPVLWQAFLQESQSATDALLGALTRQDMAAALLAIERSFRALDDFAKASALPVELTPASHRDFRKLAHSEGAAAKPSGAGGGDVAFALGSKDALQSLERALISEGKIAFLADIVPGTPAAENF